VTRVPYHWPELERFPGRHRVCPAKAKRTLDPRRHRSGHFADHGGGRLNGPTIVSRRSPGQRRRHPADKRDNRRLAGPKTSRRREALACRAANTRACWFSSFLDGSASSIVLQDDDVATGERSWTQSSVHLLPHRGRAMAERGDAIRVLFDLRRQTRWRREISQVRPVIWARAFTEVPEPARRCVRPTVAEVFRLVATHLVQSRAVEIR